MLLGGLLFSQTISWKPLSIANPAGWKVGSISVVDTQIVWGSLFQSNFSGDKVFRTLDGGKTSEVFTLPGITLNGLPYHVHALNADTAFVAVSTANGHKVEGLFRTHDGGQSWSRVFNAQLKAAAVFQVHFFSPLEGLIMCKDISSTSVSSLFFYTTDGGDTWTQSTGSYQSPCIYFESLGQLYGIYGDTVWYSGGIKNSIFRSVDRGRNWSEYRIPQDQDASILDIAFQNSMEGLAISSFLCGVGDKENQVYQTKDGGETWNYLTELKVPLTSYEANNLSFIPGTDSFYIVSSGVEPGDRGYYLSMDGGKTWSAHYASSDVYAFAFLSPSEGFAATNINDGGLMRFTGDLSSPNTGITEPFRSESFTAFPNPATSSLQVRLDMPWAGEIEIALYSVDGKKSQKPLAEETSAQRNLSLSPKWHPPGIVSTGHYKSQGKRFQIYCNTIKSRLCLNPAWATCFISHY
jgi:hypothetical protein